MVVCPLKSCELKDELRECDGSDCAWFVESHDACALWTIADELCKIRYKEAP